MSLKLETRKLKKVVFDIITVDYNSVDDKGNFLPRKSCPVKISRGLLSLRKKLSDTVTVVVMPKDKLKEQEEYLKSLLDNKSLTDSERTELFEEKTKELKDVQKEYLYKEFKEEDLEKDETIKIVREYFNDTTVVELNDSEVEAFKKLFKSCEEIPIMDIEILEELYKEFGLE